MIVYVDLRVFNCVFSRAVDLNRCYIKDIIYNTSFILFYFLKKKRRRFHAVRTWELENW